MSVTVKAWPRQNAPVPSLEATLDRPRAGDAPVHARRGWHRGSDARSRQDSSPRAARPTGGCRTPAWTAANAPWPVPCSRDNRSGTADVQFSGYPGMARDRVIGRALSALRSIRAGMVPSGLIRRNASPGCSPTPKSTIRSRRDEVPAVERRANPPGRGGAEGEQLATGIIGHRFGDPSGTVGRFRRDTIMDVSIAGMGTCKRPGRPVLVLRLHSGPGGIRFETAS